MTEPSTAPKEFAKPESLMAMLELDLEMEAKDVAGSTERARQAEELGEVELKVKLEENAADEAGHARELRRLVRGLELARNHPRGWHGNARAAGLAGGDPIASLMPKMAAASRGRTEHAE